MLLVTPLEIDPSKIGIINASISEVSPSKIDAFVQQQSNKHYAMKIPFTRCIPREQLLNSHFFHQLTHSIFYHIDNSECKDPCRNDAPLLQVRRCLLPFEATSHYPLVTL
nr:hypothetical protein [Ancylothrix sp. D3o]